jgi:hypothetical protein
MMRQCMPRVLDCSCAMHHTSPATSTMPLMCLPRACPVLAVLPPPQLVRSLTVCRVLVVPRPAYAALAADFPLSSTSMLEALQKNAEQVRGGGG